MEDRHGACGGPAGSLPAQEEARSQLAALGTWRPGAWHGLLSDPEGSFLQMSLLPTPPSQGHLTP